MSGNVPGVFKKINESIDFNWFASANGDNFIPNEREESEYKWTLVKKEHEEIQKNVAET